MVTADGKWMAYDNAVQKRSREESKELPQTLSKQVNKLSNALHQNRPEFENCKGFVTQQIITNEQLQLNLACDVLPHLPYPLNLATSDYYLFRLLQNSLKGKTFADEGAAKMHMEKFLTITHRGSMNTSLCGWQIIGNDHR